MPFPTQPARVPTAIGRLDWGVSDPTGEPTKRGIHASVEILDQNGQSMGTWSGSLVPPGQPAHVTQTEITALQNFTNTLRGRAADQLLP